jgi:isopentenyl-diphosphate delta-isomerase
VQREEVVLISAEDVAYGSMEKIQAHREGLLHRAFSVLIINDAGEMLIHQRALGKYHSAGAWSNACCGHPRPNETTQTAAERRLHEEMGFTVPLKKLYHFTYKTDLGNGLSEHEFDHVFLGVYNNAPLPNPTEVADWRYVSIDRLQQELKLKPEQFSFWFRLIMTEFPLRYSTHQTV